MQIAAALAHRRRPTELLMPSRRLTRTLAELPALLGLRSLSARITHGALERPNLIEIAPELEAIRVLARLGVGPGGKTDPMRAVRERFDRAVARRLRLDGAGRVLLGMPGASGRSFAAANDSLKVLHQVDGHPSARNDALEAHFGKRGRAEHIPSRLAQTIQEELYAADAVLVPSRAVQQQIVTAGVDPGHLIVVPYGVDVDRFSAPDRERSRGVRRLLYVGQISYRKGLPLLIEAVRRQALHLDLVGPVVAEDLLERLPDNVQHRSTVPHAELVELFAAADAFVLPSVEDAFGLVLTEALACGLPVVTTTGVGAAEILDEHDGEVVPAGEMIPLREALLALEPLSREQRRARAEVFRARVRAGRVNDWSTYTDDVITTVEDHLQSGPG